MLRNVYLEGELGNKFGSHFRMDTSTGQDILKNIYANRPEFKAYLIQCAEKNINFDMIFHDSALEDEDFVKPLEEGDVTLCIVPAGSKSGIGKLLAAAALVFIALPAIGAASLSATMPGMLPALPAGMQYSAAMKVGMQSMLGKITMSIATNLALQGVAEMMAPDPSVDTSQPTNYLFNGKDQHLEKGDPIPLLYGELRVPGRPISINIVAGRAVFANSILNADGSMSITQMVIAQSNEGED